LSERDAGDLIQTIRSEVDKAYCDGVMQIQLDPESDKSALKVVFSPLHGAANIPLRNLLTKLGYGLSVVEEQAGPDPDFSHAKNPNPEDKAAFELSIAQAMRVKADIAILTDPDGDRLGVAVLHKGEYVFLTGNQIGAVLLEYILSQRKVKGTLPSNGIVINTIVTSGLGDKIACAYGMDAEKTLTGFKFIGDRIRAYEESGEHTFFVRL